MLRAEGNRCWAGPFWRDLNEAGGTCDVSRCPAVPTTATRRAGRGDHARRDADHAVGDGGDGTGRRRTPARRLAQADRRDRTAAVRDGGGAEASARPEIGRSGNEKGRGAGRG